MEAMTTEQLQAALSGTPAMMPPEQELAAPATEAPVAASKPSDILKAAPGVAFTIKLADGRDVVLQKPIKATSFLIARILGQQSVNPALDQYCKALIWVKQIGGLPMPEPKTLSMFEGIQEQLGDEGLEEVLFEVLKQNAQAPDSAADLKKS